MSVMSPSRHSIAKGDVVLCSLPPYSTQPWLSMGVALHYALLAQAGVRARVVRPIDPPFFVPPKALHASLFTFTFDPPMEARLAAMAEAEREEPAFFAGIVDELVAGPEEVFGLSLFRNNADLSIWIARLIKERRPSAFIVLGGPEAIEDPEVLLLPWVDAVVGADAEAVIAPLMRALLSRRADQAALLRNVWINPSVFEATTSPRARPALPTPELPVIDYEPLMGLLVGDREATAPLLLNWGCPYHCAFCSNRTTYSRFTQGSVGRVLDEIDAIVRRWGELHGGSPEGLSLQISDGTTNAIPPQFDELLRGVIDRLPKWSGRPSLRGQTLLDSRVTEERVRLMIDANFNNTFFGLDSANDDLRRRLQKPGSLAQVKAAMELYRRGGLGGLGVGIPVGFPGETEGHFEETARFVDWALDHDGKVESMTVLPYVMFTSAQGPEIAESNRGERRGVLWRSDAPGGDPSERARRYMRIFERIDGRVPVSCPIPPYLALPAMLPSEDPARLDEWMDRYGRSFDQITPRQERSLREAHDALASFSDEPAWARAERVFKALSELQGWALEGFVRRPQKGAKPSLVALFRRGDRDEQAAVLLEPIDASRRAFAATRDFNVSYLKQWQGLNCTFDEPLLRRCIQALQRAEAGSAGRADSP